MNVVVDAGRRRMLRLLPAAGLAVALPAFAQQSGEKKKKEENKGIEVTPAEDLMREHGVLKRVLLVYDELQHRIAARQDFAPAVVSDAAGIIRNFIESYHEKLEEDYLFPRFRKKGKLVELVDTLQQQHAAGRRVTAQILELAGGGLKSAGDREKLAGAMHAFVRMYAPHEAREDTVLFPALREIVSPHEYDALGDEFEDKEHQLLGKDGFEGMVLKVAGIEKQLGIYDLAQFTPK